MVATDASVAAARRRRRPPRGPSASCPPPPSSCIAVAHARVLRARRPRRSRRRRPRRRCRRSWATLRIDPATAVFRGWRSTGVPPPTSPRRSSPRSARAYVAPVPTGGSPGRRLRPRGAARRCAAPRARAPRLLPLEPRGARAGSCISTGRRPAAAGTELLFQKGGTDGDLLGGRRRSPPRRRVDDHTFTYRCSRSPTSAERGAARAPGATAVAGGSIPAAPRAGSARQWPRPASRSHDHRSRLTRVDDVADARRGRDAHDDDRDHRGQPARRGDVAAAAGATATTRGTACPTIDEPHEQHAVRAGHEASR